MSARLFIHLPGRPPEARPLTRETVRIGSDPSCEIVIAHPEMPPHAATLEQRSGGFVLYNNNPYEVFVGEQAVPPGERTVWKEGAWLQITLSIGLTVDAPRLAAASAARGAVRVTEPTAAAEVATQASPKEGILTPKQWQQVGVIAACSLAAWYLLSMGSEAPPPSTDSFSSIVRVFEKRAEANKGLDEYHTQLLTLFQQAWSIDRRDGRRAPDKALKAYERILVKESIRAAPMDADTLESRLKEFASRRAQVLEMAMFQQ